jgi:hypothetical protein
VDDDDYRWFEFVDRPLTERFPFGRPWLAGASAWAEGVGTLRDPNPASAHRWLQQIRQAPKKKQAATCPRVFVSHRQSDDKQALRIAWLAQDEGWGYWLDLVDLNPSSTQQPNASPNRQLDALEKWLGGPPTHLQKSIFTAAVIEMGLLNCTHVIAAMTHNTRGSQWVPYEYGRVKEATPVAMNAASWWDSTTLKINQLPEYLHLAPVLEKENAIRGWLQYQMGQMKTKNQYPNCPGTPRDDWPQHILKPEPLPTG